MTESLFSCADHNVRVYSLNTVIVGTGAAGFNAADRLFQFGKTDIAIITEHVNAGTSRNTGSDKQTYYKLSLCGSDADSIGEMAQTLFDGGCVDGEHALCEAALSAQCFFHLAERGVPFPQTRYGEYVGYKTDHDPRCRATSVGPYTSKMMTEALQKTVEEHGIRIFNNMQVIRILTDRAKQTVCGLLCLDLTAQDGNSRFVAFRCKNIIYATGGPAGMYADSVYPHGHYGASGIAFEAGAAGKNLTEWQYGLASVKPRWNVSGTYMQVLPRFISTAPDKTDEREFLFDFFADSPPGHVLSKVFLKGYQWPFDVRKLDPQSSGSSIIDILVYLENCKGRRVFLDFTKNPQIKPVDFSSLSEEAFAYLDKAGACFGTPIERLLHMNKPAADFYRNKGIDLEKELLEIALCAQHNNGGLAVDAWWQTSIAGFFAAGEVAATHGVYRPGGSALNAGQVGSLRAARFIASQHDDCLPPQDEFDQLLCSAVENAAGLVRAVLSEKNTALPDAAQLWEEASVRMSRYGGPIRDAEKLAEAARETVSLLADFSNRVCVKKTADLQRVFRLHDMLVSQSVYLAAMADYIKAGGKSRGSALYTDKNGKKPYDNLPDTFAFTPDDGSFLSRVQEAAYNPLSVRFSWREVRPVPVEDTFFENVWRTYRESGNVY